MNVLHCDSLNLCSYISTLFNSGMFLLNGKLLQLIQKLESKWLLRFPYYSTLLVIGPSPSLFKRQARLVFEISWCSLSQYYLGQKIRSKIRLYQVKNEGIGKVKRCYLSLLYLNLPMSIFSTASAMVTSGLATV